MPSSLRIWHPFTNGALDPPPLKVARAEGVYLELEDGRRILDGVSSWWVNLHGHTNPKIAAAIAAQARKMEHVMMAGFTHQAAEEFVERLQKWIPEELTQVFFSDDGSTAVEVALKLAVQFFHNQGRGAKHEIVALQYGYHGDTAGAMSVSDDSPFTDAFQSMISPIHRVHSAHCYRCPVGKKRESCHIECREQLAALLADRGEKIAAVIVEPLLQAAGGMVVHPVEFLRDVRALCTQHDVLLIADEVLTGFGRTGQMFACGLAGIVPDLMCLSKGITGGFLPMGATLTSQRIKDGFDSENRMHTFYHGHSYTGNALACAAANASLQIFDEESVFDRIHTITKITAERLKQFPGMPAVAETRHLGTVGIVELVAEDSGYLSAMKPKLYRFFLDRGVLLRPLGNVVYVLPPYVIAPDELHRVYDVIVEAMQTLF